MEPWMITLGLAGLVILIPIIVVIVRYAQALNSAGASLKTAPIFARCA